MIVVAGEALVDRVTTSDGATADALGGAPYNVARAIARLGVATEFAGAVSTDELGDELSAQLERDGVSLRRVQRVEAPTTLALADVDDRGTARYEFVLEGTSAPMLERLGSIGRDVDAVVTGGLGLVLHPMATTIIDALGSLHDDLLLFVDVNCRPAVIADRGRYLAELRRLLTRADVVKVSDEDLDVLAPDVDVETLLSLGAAAVIVTAGGDGNVIVTPAGRIDVPVSPLPGPLVDTIGAGDTFSAGFVAWWTVAGFGRAGLRGEGAFDRLAAAVAAAGQAASVTVTRRGCDPPHLSDLPPTWSTTPFA